MQPLRILIGSDTFAPDINGAARFTERLAAGLVDRGHEVHVVAAAPGRGPDSAGTEVIEGRPMTVHRWRSVKWPLHEWLRFVWPWHAKRQARRLVAQLQPDVVHLQSHYVIGRGLVKAAHERGIPIVGTNHSMPQNLLEHTGLPPSLNRVLVAWAWRDLSRLYGMAVRVTTPTRRAADYLEANTQLTGVLPVSCGIAADRYRPALGPKPERRVVFVGRQDHEKHIDVLVRAVALLDDDVHLDLIGHGEAEAELAALAADLGIAHRVHQYGAVDDEVIVERLSRATLFAIASTAELQSIATLEAMSSGLPIVAADAMALPHLVADGVNGWLFPPGDVEACADRMRRVLSLDAAGLEAMQRASIDGTRIHSLEHTLDVFEALYRGTPLPDGTAASAAVGDPE